MKITKTRALEIYSTIYPEDDVREAYDDPRRNFIAEEVQLVCAVPSLEEAVEVVNWWPISGAELRKAVVRIRAMGRAKR